MAGADRLDPADRIEHFVGRFLIDVAGIGVRSLGKDAAGVGGGVDNRDSSRTRQIEHRVGVAVGEGKAVVGDEGVEVPVVQERHHLGHGAGGEADRLRQPLLLDPEQLAERAVARGRLLERTRMLGVVQMQKVDALEPQRLEALLDRAAGLGGVEAVCLGVAVELGRNHEARRQAAALADDRADPLLAPAHAIEARRIDEIGRAAEDRHHRRLGPIRVDAVAVGVRHVAQPRCPEADARDHEVGAAQADFIHNAFAQRDPPQSGSRRMPRAPAESRQGRGRRRRAPSTMLRMVPLVSGESLGGVKLAGQRGCGRPPAGRWSGQAPHIQPLGAGQRSRLSRSASAG